MITDENTMAGTYSNPTKLVITPQNPHVLNSEGALIRLPYRSDVSQIIIRQAQINAIIAPIFISEEYLSLLLKNEMANIRYGKLTPNWKKSGLELTTEQLNAPLSVTMEQIITK